MKFVETPIRGAYVVEPEPREDERGFFAVVFSQKAFSERGLGATVIEYAISYNRRKGTLRGMHYQAKPHEQPKMVACGRGAIYDVIVDLRRGSATYKGWFGVELTPGNRRLLYVPEGLAHGFQALEDETEVVYHLYAPYAPGFERGVRWNDPSFGIRWPLDVAVISPRDGAYEDFKG